MMASITQTTRFLLLALLTMSIVACGFHLRGQVAIPDRYQTLTLTSNSQSDSFDRALRIALKKAGISIVDKDSATENSLELKINPITSSDTVLVRNTSNDIVQIERRLNATYFVREADGKSLYGPRNVSTNRTLANQNAEKSVKSAYNKTQTDSMSEDLANQIIYDLGYAPL